MKTEKKPAFPVEVSVDENENDVNHLLAEVKAGIHKQFIFNSEKERVECRCGHVAVWWKTGYLCGTITAYPCRFN